jgi:hypothetical protein
MISQPASLPLNRAAVVALGAVAAVMALTAAAANAQPSPAAITCTNSSSGTTWQISIDYGKSTVDSSPARISDSTISWHDAKDNINYSLDRSSGSLTEIVPSSTGGYALIHQCALKKSG